MVLAVQRWFERHPDEPIRIHQVAHHVGLSPRTLTRRFSTAIGEPPSRYLQRLRVEHAKEQLAEPGTTVSQAARAVGYTDVTAFSATFRRLVGVPPSKYRPHQQSK